MLNTKDGSIVQYVSDSILIGSRAMMLHGYKFRDPKDWDWICTTEQACKLMRRLSPCRSVQTKDKITVWNPNAEFEIVQEGKSNCLLHELVNYDAIRTSFGLVPSLDLLFTIKQSHRYLRNSPHWWKTAFDWHRLRSMGCKVRPEYLKFLELREKETYTYKHPSLNQSSKDFFSDDNIEYVYEHDSIHRAIAINSAPAYTYYLEDGREVKCSKEKFFDLPIEYRINGVIEEAMTLALERSLIPFPGKNTPTKAWLYALSKVLSSITSGWFREWGYENLLEILKIGPGDYYNKFLRAVESGVVIKL